MKVLLFRPPSSLGTLKAVSHVHHPLSIAYIASYVMRHGHEARIYDCEVEPFDREKIVEAVRGYGPDVVGISCFTAGIHAGNIIAGWVKEAREDIITVVGGPHVDAIPERTLREFPFFDIAAKGDGEITFNEICEEHIRGRDWRKIQGIFWRGRDAIVANVPRDLTTDLDSLPFPARHLLALEKYTGGVTPGVSSGSGNATEMILSRGCPFKCTYCAVKATFGLSVRFRSAQNILAEVKECRERFGFRHIFFVDSTFTLKPRLVYGLCDGLTGLGVTWNCTTRPELIPDDLLERMARAGCVKISYGVETGSPRVAKLIGREHDRDTILDAFRRTRAKGIMTGAFFIIGSHPSETPGEIEMMSRLAREIDADFTAFSVLTPYPGTPVYELMRAEGLIGEEKWENFAHHNPVPTWRTRHFSGEELVRIRKKLIRRHYFTPRFIFRTLRRVRSISDLRYYAVAGLTILRHTSGGVLAKGSSPGRR